jgi:hypothetical protein
MSYFHWLGRDSDIAHSKLQVRIVEAGGVPGNAAVALCDAQGNYLPMQVECSVKNEVDSYGLVTASFHIDGRDVALVA